MEAQILILDKLHVHTTYTVLVQYAFYKEKLHTSISLQIVYQSIVGLYQQPLAYAFQ